MQLNDEQLNGLAGFRSALRSFIAASEAISRTAGITQQQYQAMLVIKTRPSEAMPIKELAEQLLMTHHAAVQLVDRLTKAGLAQRSPSAEDRRSVILSLTPLGETLLDELAVKHLDEMQRQEPQLTKSLHQLRRIALINGRSGEADSPAVGGTEFDAVGAM
jgi:DNA-binding MarR family transcriptional regulator